MNQAASVTSNIEGTKAKPTDVELLLMGIHRHLFPATLADKAKSKETMAPLLIPPPISKLKFVRIDKIRYRNKKDIKYSMSSLYSALHGTEKPLTFLLIGDKNKTTIYLGFWLEENSNIHLEGSFRSAIKGFIPGSEFSDIPDSAEILRKIKSFKYINALTGIPSEKHLFQDEKRNAPIENGIERFANAMTGDSYALMIIAQPLHHSDSGDYFKNLSSLLDYIHRLTKISKQYSTGKQSGTSSQKSESSGETEQTGNSEGSSESWQDSPWIIKRWGKGIEKFLAGGESPSKQISKQFGSQYTQGTSHTVSTSIGTSTNSTESESQTIEKMNHQAIFAEELLKMLQQRLKNGMGEGLWQTNVLLLSDSIASANKGCNILKGMWSGEKSHLDPIRYLELSQLFPHSSEPLDNAITILNRSLWNGHPLGTAYSGGYTWLTSSELALEANLPYYELPSLASEEIVEYGRYLPSYDIENQIKLGELVDQNIETDTPVYMDTLRLNRHLFVTGLTGAGKSNTMRSILLELARLGISFLVIEPVKSEYRCLNDKLQHLFKEGKSKFEKVEVLSLSSKNFEELVLNPFAFEVKEGGDHAIALISHIDRLKAVFNSALGMYSSMPYILEEMIYKAYANAGWDITTGKNKYLEEAKQKSGLQDNAELRNLFLPRLSDLVPLVDGAIADFFPGQSDYGVSLTGALKSRLNSLTRGAKGQLLNQCLSLPTKMLLDRPCVIELESFADNDEKAFVMALLLSRIYEFREGKLADKLKHVLVIEEAHRLLSKPPQPGEHSSNSRGKGVEVFADMLAEVRAYGQGIVIVDQIPAKLIPDVLKNTDVKIVHKLTAKEDRESVGTAMNLDKKQIDDLSKSTPGLATVAFDGLNRAIRVKINYIPLENNMEVPITSQPKLSAFEAYKQSLFFEQNHDAPIILSPKQKNSAYKLARGLLFIALLTRSSNTSDNSYTTSILASFKDQLLASNAQNGYQAFVKPEELWPCVNKGIFILINELLRHGIQHSDAVILATLFAAFAAPWSQEGKSYSSGLANLEDFISQESPLLLSDDKQLPRDYLTCILQAYADNIKLLDSQKSFHELIANAIKEDTDGTFITLQKILYYYLNDLTWKQIKPIQQIPQIEFYVRLLRCFKSNDEFLNKKVQSIVDTWLRFFPKNGRIFIEQQIQIHSN